MPRRHKDSDRIFLITTLLLTVVGVLIFSSASLGLVARSEGSFWSFVMPQLVLGVGGGLCALALLSHIPYRSYRRFAPHLFGVALVLTLLVFVPGLGYEAQGARRWLLIGGFSFQPAELLKVAFIICLAWYFSVFHQKTDDIRYSVSGYLVLLGLAGAILLAQPDTGTFAILALTGGAMSIAAGVRFTHLAGLGVLLAVGLMVLAFSRPYLLDRVETFINPVADPQGSGYQIRQSLIAIGSGGWLGRGYGQSVQKFHYLPEPEGDSVFSVAAEELGFVGSVVLLFLFVLFALRGLTIAARAPDRFGGLTVVGIVILIVTQSFINIASMLGLIPLTGEPLAFISKGGTALLFTLASAGIVLNISRFTVTKQPT